MRYVYSILIISIIITGCVTQTPSPLIMPKPSLIPNGSPMPTNLSTNTPEPSATSVPTSTAQPSATPTETPIGGFPQIFIGFEPGTLRINGCGGATYITMDHDLSDNSALSFWDKYPEFPKPESSYRTKDGRRILDVCTHVGREIWWAMDEGEVTEARPGILVILIKQGYGVGLSLTVQHCVIAEGITVGSIVRYGDTIAYTARELMPPVTETDASPTAIGLFKKGGGYHSDQEMMLIGPDGQPNIVYYK